ncbi:hypothetical protein CLK_1078 [Clostridium botulinum A3 str. Loch Maree]|nr:hypothetical protein CLK_1078 [Clostridium botulinum A3 str. Loch Maree]
MVRRDNNNAITPREEVNIFLILTSVTFSLAIGINIAAISRTKPQNTPFLSMSGKRYFSIFKSLINNSIQLARATELALPIIATANIDNNIMLDSI